MNRPAMEQTVGKGAGTRPDGRQPIAIVGIGCRFPGGVKGPESLWRLLGDGVDAITEVPPERFDAAAYYDPTPSTAGKMTTRWGGFLDGIDLFDAAFFGISPREAERLDPQQRLLLEVAWEALEDAGVPPDRLVGSRSGVFIGLWTSDYRAHLLADPDHVDFYMINGSGRYAAAGRLSYVLGLCGPSLALDSACSSSLVAAHLACQSLWRGECDLALAGGANAILLPQYTIAFSDAQMMAPDGRCKFGDASGNGFVRSDGVGIVVLKPLARALADGDPIYALIEGSAVNNDGRASGSLGRPAVEGQVELLRLAYADAGISPSEVDYVEAHGTGTSAGDPVELAALGRVLSAGRPEDEPCFVGSIKANVGHTEGAAGVAGLIKVALMLHHRAIPTSLHLDEPNPDIPWSDLPLVIPREQRPWPARGRPAVAGVSAFGMAGTNAHLVLTEPPAPADDVPEPEGGAGAWHLLPLSARSPEALAALAQATRARVAAAVAPALADLAYCASRRRSHHEHRLALVASSLEELAGALSAYLEGEPRAGVFVGPDEPGPPPKVVFVFPGQGGQWPGMARELLEREPRFRAALARCDASLRGEVDWSLLEQLGLDEGAPGYRLDQIDVIQPALLAVQIALADQWRAWGIVPDAVIGHSMGEVAAAHVAGALDLDAALKVIAVRSRLLRRVSGQGAMAVVELSLAQAQAALAGWADQLAVATSNSPRSTVVAGDPAALDAWIDQMQRADVFCRRVNVDVASHSPQMERLVPELVAALAGLRTTRAGMPIYSTVEGEVVDGTRMGPAYWARNLRQTVLFGPMVERLLAAGHGVFIELGPHPILLPAIQQTADDAGQVGLTLPSMRRETSDQATLRGSLGMLYAAGYPVDWASLYPRGRHVRLPTYPWQRQRYWFDSPGAADRRPRTVLQAPPAEPAAATSRPAAPDATSADVGGWLHELRWRLQAGGPAATGVGEGAGSWLILADRAGLGVELAERLVALGETCTLAFAGAVDGALPDGAVRLDPAQPADYRDVVAAAFGPHQPPCRGIVHLWSLDMTVGTDGDPAAPPAAPALGALGALYLAQALSAAAVVPAGRLWLVTRGAQAVGVADGPLAPAQAPLWGLAAVLANEQASLRCGSVDLDPAAGAGAVAALLAELSAGSVEERVAFRGPERFVARLARVDADRPPVVRPRVRAEPGQAYRLELARPGRLDELVLSATSRRPAGPGEVEIQVVAAGLNFIDVLKALGTYPGQSAEEPVALGAECAGRVVAVGDGVDGLRDGDEVVAVSPNLDRSGFFGSHATVPANRVLPKPARLSFEQAAASPLVYLTAAYGLEHLARLAPGETILIHSATGGVGLAAIALARAAGAEVLATAGSPEKRSYLRELGIAHVMDSRRLDFAAEVLAATAGRGVDVVLNSLAGAAIPASLAVLAPHGRFLEIGKRDIYENAALGLEPFRRSLSFFAIDLARLLVDQPERCRHLLTDLMARLEAGSLPPLPLTACPMSEAAAAFHTMAQARHVGKIVLSPDEAAVLLVEPVPAATVRPDGAYLISGGLGGIGLQLAGWLADRGARHLALLGRSAPSAAAQAAIDALVARGIQVVALQADVGDGLAVAAALRRCGATLPPLRGIVHAAGVVDDALLERQDEATFGRVMAPKVEGAWQLHRLTRDLPLDWFILCSSATVWLGIPGQANYAAANAYLDALAHHRRAQGLPAQSINWGPWAQVGLAAAQANRGARLAEQGLASMSPERALVALARATAEDRAQVGVMALDVDAWAQANPAAATAPLLAELRQAPVANGRAATAAVRQALAATEPGARRQALLTDHVRQQVAQVLRLAPAGVPVARPLKSLGLDSLMALELRRRLEASLGLTLSTTVIWNYPTIAALVPYLALQMGLPLTPEEAEAGPPVGAAEPLAPVDGASWPREPGREQPARATELAEELAAAEEMLRRRHHG
jgi:acyl transferase domain-containing protein/acyl carrier protein